MYISKIVLLMSPFLLVFSQTNFGPTNEKIPTLVEVVTFGWPPPFPPPTSNSAFTVFYNKHKYRFEVEDRILTNNIFYFDIDSDGVSDLLFYTAGYAAHGDHKVTLFSTKYLKLFSTIKSDLFGYANNGGFKLTKIDKKPGILTLKPNYNGHVFLPSGDSFKAISNYFYYFEGNIFTNKATFPSAFN